MSLMAGLLLVILTTGCTQKQPATVAKPAAVKPAKPAAEPATPTQETAAPATADAAVDRVGSIDAIGERGSKGKADLDTLLAALDDESAGVRWHAARSIGLIGEAAAPAIPKLLAKLADADAVVVTQAAAAVGRIRTDDQRDPSQLDPATKAAYASAVRPLVDCIVHSDPRVRRAALRSLEAIHPDRAKVVEMANGLLADADPSVVFPALQSLADMGESAVPFLLESLDHPKARYWATLALSEIGPAAAAAVPKLTEMASRTSDGKTAQVEERLQAIMALAAIGEPAAEAADELVSVVASSDAEEKPLQPAAIYALGKMRAKSGFEPLEAFLASDNPVLSAASAWARARIRPEDAAVVADAVARLRKGFSNTDATIRQGAVSAIHDLAEEMSPAEAAVVANDLAALLSDADPEVRRSTALGLVVLGKPAIEPVIAAFADPKRRAVATEILGEMGPAAAAAVPMLVKALGDDDDAVRSDAAFAIASIGAEAEEAVPALMKLLDERPNADAEPGSRSACYTAAYALGTLGAAAKPAAEKLESLVGSSDPILATAAAWAGLKIEPDRKDLYAKAIPLLVKALGAPRDLARLEAASALGELGPAAKDAVPQLEIIAEDDPVAAVREAAEEALRTIAGR